MREREKLFWLTAQIRHYGSDENAANQFYGHAWLSELILAHHHYVLRSANVGGKKSLIPHDG